MVGRLTRFSEFLGKLECLPEELEERLNQVEALVDLYDADKNRKEILEGIIGVMNSYTEVDPLFLERAFNIAYEFATAEENRDDGTTVFSHCLYPAIYSIRYFQADEATVAASFLHDYIEDSSNRMEDLYAGLGTHFTARNTMEIIEGVTNIGNNEEHQLQNLEKCLEHSYKTPEVFLVRMCDRLHNIRTLASLSKERQLRILKETWDVYMPIARYLGERFRADMEEACKEQGDRLGIELRCRFEKPARGNDEEYLVQQYCMVVFQYLNWWDKITEEISGKESDRAMRFYADTRLIVDEFNIPEFDSFADLRGHRPDEPDTLIEEGHFPSSVWPFDVINTAAQQILFQLYRLKI